MAEIPREASSDLTALKDPSPILLGEEVLISAAGDRLKVLGRLENRIVGARRRAVVIVTHLHDDVGGHVPLARSAISWVRSVFSASAVAAALPMAR